MNIGSVRLNVPAPAQAALDHPIGGPLLKVAAATVAFYVAVSASLHANGATLFNGLANGALYGLIGVGIVLIYRTNRIINFAAAGLGAVPGVTAALLLVIYKPDSGFLSVVWYPMCFLIAVVGGALLGAVIDVTIIRRFATAPRLILTVATIGVTQVLAFLSLKIPIWMGSDGDLISYVPTWWKELKIFGRSNFSIGSTPFTWDYPFTLLIVAAVVGGLAAFLRFTPMGIALRASAENADRASLLGIPVRRVGTVSWILAGSLAGLVIFLRAAIVGVPTDGSLGPKVLLFALTAAVIGRMDSIPVTLIAGMFVGMVAEAAVANTGADSLATAIMLPVILAAMLLQRGRFSRAMDTGVSTWQTVQEYRPIPQELAKVREVVLAKRAFGLLVAGLFLFLPKIVGESQIGYAQIVVIWGLVAVSLVILTGWAGQISLGQFGIVGGGALMAGWLVTHENQDFFVVLVVAALVGAALAALVGLPALRIPGLYLAVTTLAFAATMENYVLRKDYPIGSRFLPQNYANVDLPVLWGRLALTNTDGGPTTGFYYVSLAILGLSVLAAKAYRRNRAGRVVIAVRDNVRGASSYSVNAARTKLAAFAISGAIASVAGALMAFQTRAVDDGIYGIGNSLEVFILAAIGGLTSLPGAVLGVTFLKSVELFGGDLVDNLNLLVTGPGLLLVLLFLPGGFAEGAYRLRDSGLRWVAEKRGIHVPSLVADRRIEAEQSRDVITAASQSAEGHAGELVGAAAGGEG